MPKKFCVDIPHGRIEASTYRTFVARLRAERDFWLELEVPIPIQVSTNSHIQNAVQPLLNRLTEMLQYWSRKVSEVEEIDGRHFPELFEEVRRGMVAATVVPPHSGSMTAKNIMRLFHSGDRENAVAILMGFCLDANPLLPHRTNQYETVGAYLGFVRGLYGSQKVAEFSSQPTIERLVSDKEIAEGIVEELGLELVNVRSDIEQQDQLFKQKTEQNTKRLRRKYRELLEGQKSLCGELEAAEESRKTTFDELLQAFNAHLRLKRPVKLWEERQAEHEASSEAAWKQFVVGAVLLTLSAMLSALFLGETIASSFVKAGCIVGTEPQCSGISPKGPFYVSMVFLVSSVSIWYLRLQMKLYLSERHLALDARERRAFAETYLSLLKGAHVSSDHEAVILGSLFRPTQDGIISDDVGPEIGLSALFAKALDRR